MPLTSGPEVQRARVAQLFEFLKAFSDLRNPPVCDITKHEGVLWLDSEAQPQSDVEVHRIPPADDRENGEVFLRVTRPVVTECPPPSSALRPWLLDGWERPDGEVKVRSVLTAPPAKFDANPRLRQDLAEWERHRTKWALAEAPARSAMALFSKLYSWHGTLEREGEKMELVVADGLLALGPGYNHPVLMQALELAFYPDGRQPTFELRRRETPPELYVEFLRALPEVNGDQIRRCIEEQKSAEFSPTGGDDTDAFFQRLIQGLFPRSGIFLAPNDPVGKVPTIRRAPAVLLRTRRGGAAAVFQAILEDIKAREEAFSAGLLQMTGLAEGPAPKPNDTLPQAETQLASEDDEVLFAKPANREQLQIAQQLSRKNSVLVQGPPGTGKTHTIANLLGHLLAQGKRVLVTAHTPKALRVLRSKVVEPLRPLCVSVLQNDKQSQEELQASVKAIHQRLSSDPASLEADVKRLTEERSLLLVEIRRARFALLEARQDETREIVFGGKGVVPVLAAKRVKAGIGQHDWIPSPVSSGACCPLSSAEVADLYTSNALISAADEEALRSGRPNLSTLPSPATFRLVVEETNRLKQSDLSLRAELWAATARPGNLARFEQILKEAHATIDFLKSSTPWQLQAIQAGRDGTSASRVWHSLAELIDSAWTEIQHCNLLVMEHGPTCTEERDPSELLSVVDEIIAHAERGGGFGLLTRLTHRHWFELAQTVRIGGRKLDLAQNQQVKSLRALLRMRELRSQLSARWERQIAPHGGPAAADLTEQPEHVCRQYVGRIRHALEWHSKVWSSIEGNFHEIGFRWSLFLETSAPVLAENAELERMRAAIVNDLAPILQTRRDYLRFSELRLQLAEWLRIPLSSFRPEAAATHQLRLAMQSEQPSEYDFAFRELERLQRLEDALTRRCQLLDALRSSAPAWAAAIASRSVGHNAHKPPGDTEAAWDWRQMHDELDRRAKTSLPELQEQIEKFTAKLMVITSKLIEAKTWLSQIRHTNFEQRRALGAYATLRNKLSKTGTGVRDAEFRAAARREMTQAKDAVPVWIMPLAEAAASFDPRTTRFDVVIIDEASQCDPTGLFAIYMAKQVVVVGDDEQVTPVSVGQAASEVAKLIGVMLEGIPHKELYDGETSIYELSQIAFGGVIRLTEHFRCAPDIIAFSNRLSYRGEIKPLRETGVIPLRPNVVTHRVAGGAVAPNQTNIAEAEEITALICAAIRSKEYSRNEEGRPTTFGVVSLLGPQQAICVDNLLRQRLSPVEYRNHEVLCGDAAQFQGDERDVMFLSLVDSSPEDPPLPMRQEGAKKIFKKRFNVAASRARNQMWVVHSLTESTDLQPGDYRRRLIEHSIDPGAWERDLRERLKEVDPNSKVFEGGVLRHLLDRGYKTIPQYQVGSYFIDLVVVGHDGKRLAVECDGEQYHGPDQLQHDIERQSVLERLGWKFSRIRGSLYFRNQDRAMADVFARLNELGIKPTAVSDLRPQDDGTTASLVRAAQELRRKWADASG